MALGALPCLPQPQLDSTLYRLDENVRAHRLTQERVGASGSRLRFCLGVLLRRDKTMGIARPILAICR